MPSQPRYHLINEKGTNALWNPLKIYGCLIGMCSTTPDPQKSFMACLFLHVLTWNAVLYPLCLGKCVAFELFLLFEVEYILGCCYKTAPYPPYYLTLYYSINNWGFLVSWGRNFYNFFKPWHCMKMTDGTSPNLMRRGKQTRLSGALHFSFFCSETVALVKTESRQQVVETDSWHCPNWCQHVLHGVA